MFYFENLNIGELKMKKDLKVSPGIFHMPVLMIGT